MLYVATHKKTLLPKANWIVPIGLSGYQDDDVIKTDATGQSISHLNKNFCELTATYWIEKNCNDPYLGLCHYRRLFSFIAFDNDQNKYPSFIEIPSSDSIIQYCSSDQQKDEMMKILKSYELITPRPVYQTQTIAAAFMHSHGKILWELFLDACIEEFGSDVGYYNSARNFYWGNMLVASSEIFKDYSLSLFRVIHKVYNRVGDIEDVPGTRYQPCRYPGYLAERFMGLYIYARRLRNFETPTIWLS
jgi:hypothetical protein